VKVNSKKSNIEPTKNIVSQENKENSSTVINKKSVENEV
jgi:hypothetical protein